MIEVELSDLKKVGREVAKMLHDRLRVEVTIKGGTLVVQDPSNTQRIGVKDVKEQVKHVLHYLGFDEGYRVLSEQRKVKIARVEEKRRPPAERKGSAPPPAKTLPYLFP